MPAVLPPHPAAFAADLSRRELTCAHIFCVTAALVDGGEAGETVAHGDRAGRSLAGVTRPAEPGDDGPPPTSARSWAARARTSTRASGVRAHCSKMSLSRSLTTMI